ncbi:MAG: hypothetical protein EOM25_07535 [Deltaproteobacteria bacterium]|nr:hypothetical protein [Deltaproteobacteria bacterium]
MRDNYNEQGRVFVDTRYLMDVTRQGGLEFRHNCALSGIPLKKIYFKGDKGFLLAPDGSRVIVLTMHGKKAMPRFNAKGFYRIPLGRHLIIGA